MTRWESLSSSTMARMKSSGLLREYRIVRLRSGEVCRAELHWYEAHGIGRRELKFKRFLE
jgi:hypothetical protein